MSSSVAGLGHEGSYAVSKRAEMGKPKRMTEHERTEEEAANAELLPPREVMSLLNTDPSAYSGLLADPTAAGTTSPDTTAGATDAAGSAVGQAHDLADAQSAGDATQSVSDQPQTISTDSTQTASSET
jgi:hypothetical protein